jgi:hypothetical protein
MRLGTFVCVFSASPFATRTAGKSTIARGGWRGRDAAPGSFVILVIARGKNPDPFCRILDSALLCYMVLCDIITL